MIEEELLLKIHTVSDTAGIDRVKSAVDDLKKKTGDQVPQVTGLSKAWQDMGTQGEKALQGLAAKFGALGGVGGAAGQAMTKALALAGPAGIAVTAIVGVTLAVGALASKFIELGRERKAALNELLIATGAEGAALEQLRDSAEHVTTVVPIGLRESAKLMGELKARTGAEGEELEAMTVQVAQLQQLGMDVTVASLTRVYGDWSIATKDQTAANDALFRAHQLTVASMESLSQKAVAYGAPMRALGFTFEESVAMLGKWEKEGVNTELVLGGMKKAAGALGDANIEMTGGFRALLAAVTQAKTEEEAFAIAKKAVGVRAAIDFMKAIQEERFELAGLDTALSTTGQGIAATAEATLTSSQKIQMFKARVSESLAPLSDFALTVRGGIMTGLIALGDRILPVVSTGARVLAAVFGFLWRATSSVVHVVTDLVQRGLAMIPFVATVRYEWNLLRDNLENIKIALLTVKSFFDDFVAMVRDRAAPIIADLRQRWQEGWQQIQDGAREAVMRVVEFVRSIPERLTELAASVRDRFIGMRDSAVGAVTSLRDGVVEKWRALKQDVHDALDSIKDRLTDFVEDHRTAILAVIAILALLTAPLRIPVAVIIAVASAIRSNWDSITAKFTEAKDKIVSTLSGVRDAFTGWLGHLREKFQGAQESSQQTTSAMSEHWSDAQEKVGGTVERLGSRIGDAWASIRTRVGSAVGTLVSWISERWHALADWLGRLHTNIANMFSRIWTWIRNTVSSVVHGLASAVSGALVGLWNWLKDSFLIPLGSMFSTFWRNMVDRWANAGDAIVSGFVDAMQAVWGVVKGALVAVGTFVQRAFTSLINRLVSMVQSIAAHIPGLSGILSGLRNALSGGEGPGLFDRIAATLEGWVATAKAAASRIKQAFLDRFHEIRDNLREKIKELTGGGEGEQPQAPEGPPIDTSILDPLLRDDEKLKEEKEKKQKAIKAAKAKAPAKEIDETIRLAQDRLKKEQEEVEAWENELHEQVMSALQAELDRRELIHDRIAKNLADEKDQLQSQHADRLRDLEAEKQAFADQIQANKDRLDEMGRQLGRLKLDLNLEAENAKLDELEKKLGRFASMFKELERVESDPKKAQEAELKRQREQVRLANDEQRQMLQQALDQNLVAEEDRRTVELLMQGYKQRAVDVERIMGGINQKLQGQVDNQQGIVDAKARQISAAERELELAKQLADEEEARLSLLMKGVDDRITKENEAYARDLANVEGRIAAEQARWEAEKAIFKQLSELEDERHAARMAAIEEEYAMKLMQLEMSDEEIRKLIHDQEERARQIASQAESMYLEMLKAIRDAGVEAGEAIADAMDRAIAGVVVIVDLIHKAVVDLGRDVGQIGDAASSAADELRELAKLWRGMVGGHERALPTEDQRSGMFAGKRGSGGFRAGHNWAQWHYGARGITAVPEPGGGMTVPPGQPGVGGIAPPPGAIPVAVTMGDLKIVGMNVKVQIDGRDIAARVLEVVTEDVQMLDTLGKRLNERQARTAPVGGVTS